MNKLPPDVFAYLSKLGKKGSKTTNKILKNRPNYYKELSKKGVEARRKKAVENLVD